MKPGPDRRRQARGNPHRKYPGCLPTKMARHIVQWRRTRREARVRMEPSWLCRSARRRRASQCTRPPPGTRSRQCSTRRLPRVPRSTDARDLWPLTMSRLVPRRWGRLRTRARAKRASAWPRRARHDPPRGGVPSCPARAWTDGWLLSRGNSPTKVPQPEENMRAGRPDRENDRIGIEQGRWAACEAPFSVGTLHSRSIRSREITREVANATVATRIPYPRDEKRGGLRRPEGPRWRPRREKT